MHAYNNAPRAKSCLRRPALLHCENFKCNKYLLIAVDLVVSQSEICIGDGEYCGTTVSISKTPCCGGLKCVLDSPHGIPPCPNCKPWTLKCLDCNNELCGGPNNTKCCPMYGCTRTDDNTSFGKCVPFP